MREEELNLESIFVCIPKDFSFDAFKLIYLSCTYLSRDRTKILPTYYTTLFIHIIVYLNNAIPTLLFYTIIHYLWITLYLHNTIDVDWLLKCWPRYVVSFIESTLWRGKFWELSTSIKYIIWDCLWLISLKILRKMVTRSRTLFFTRLRQRQNVG